MIHLGRHVPSQIQSTWTVLSTFTPRRTFITEGPSLPSLQARCMLAQATRLTTLYEVLESGKRQVIYAGVDPTATSMHIGNMIPMMCLLHFQLRGHQIIPLIGGATALIGDPSGRLVERQPAIEAAVETNVTKLTTNVEKFFERGLAYAHKRLPASKKTIFKPEILNNMAWLKDLNLINFLRTVGPSSRVNTMLNRESVHARLESQKGISFTEFSYQLLQAYDFYQLYKNSGCNIQVGGSDQWGNILAGVDLINSVEAVTPGNHTSRNGFGITTPLLTTATGRKFGKSEGNAVWLDEQMTSAYDFYQFWLRTPDTVVERYLKMFTLLPIHEIENIVRLHSLKPEKREAQRHLADEVTLLVHTETGVRKAREITSVLFDADYSNVNAGNLLNALQGDPRLVLCEEEEILNIGIAKLAAAYRLVSSASAARSLVTQNGLYLNDEPVHDIHQTIKHPQLIGGRIAIIRAGRDKHLVLAEDWLTTDEVKM